MLAGAIVNTTRDRADVSVRLLDRHIVSEAPDCTVVMRGPARIFAVKIGWHPQARVWRELKPVREHANHGEDRVINFQARPRKVLRRSEILLPISITDQSDWSGAFPRVRGAEIAPDDRLNPEDLEKVGGDTCNHRAGRLRST